MKILLTGANGYIGRRLLPVLLEAGHEVVCCVRDKRRIDLSNLPSKRITLLKIDFRDEVVPELVPKDIDVAYYLLHSMSYSKHNFEDMERLVAMTFLEFIGHTSCKQIIYLSGIVNTAEANLSEHLHSRLAVERILGSSTIPLTVLRAGIIVGSGSASFEIIRDLTEKLPIMIAPKWLNTRCQPIAIRNVIEFLMGVVLHPKTLGEIYDIGGSDVLSYKEMLLGYAKNRKLKRWIFTVPVMTPRLSAKWLFLVTSTSSNLATNLVDSMKIDVVARDNRLAKLLGIKLYSYQEALEMAFDKIRQSSVISSWKDALASSTKKRRIFQYIQVPEYGVFEDKKIREIPKDRQNDVLENLWAIGGERGWYYSDFLWKIRGFMDKLIGGVGLRRGRTNTNKIYPGDALDFWRVLVADKNQKRLLLYAEMKLPGNAWLEFNIKQENGISYLYQTATFRPLGVLGRLYWYSVLPFHYFVFNGMINNIISYNPPSIPSE